MNNQKIKINEGLPQRKRGYEEKIGWYELTGRSFEKIWDNPKDDEIWKKYLEK